MTSRASLARSRAGPTLLGVALAALLGGCVAEQLQGGRYACVVDAGPEQCPGAWRCGRDGYCHEVGDISVAWRCVDPGDCERGWQCGLNEQRDGGECHDPAVGSPHACLSDDHCTAGWHCGPALRCYDRRVAAAHACRFDAGDCADGWRCGLGGLCQDQDAGAAYRCQSDAGLDDGWCEQGWRCAPEGQCVDPRADALRALSFTPGAPEWMSPLYLQRQPSLLAVSEPFGRASDKQSIAFVDDNRLVYLERTFGEVPLGMGTIGLLLDAGRLEAPQALAAVERRMFVSSDGGLVEYAIEPDGGIVKMPPSDPACLAFFDYTPVAHQHLRNYSGVQGVIAFSDSPDAGYALLIPSGCNVSIAFNYIRSTPPARISDMAALLVPAKDGGASDECYFLADSRGLWVADFDNLNGLDYPFVPVDNQLFPNSECGATPTQELLGLKVTDERYLVVRSRPADGGITESVSLADLTRLISEDALPCFSSRSCRNDPVSPQPLEVDQVFGPCPVCPGSKVMSFFAVADPPRKTPAVEVRCEAVPDAGVPQQSYLVRGNLAGGCAGTLLPGVGSLLADDVVASLASQTGVAYAGTRGQIWTGPSSENAPPLALDRSPDGVAQVRLAGEDAGRAVAISPGFLSMHEPTVGYVGFSPVSPDRIIGAVEGSPRLAFTNRKAVLDLDGLDPLKGPRTIAFSQDSSRFDPPYLATVTAVTATRAELFVAADDRVFTAQLSWQAVVPAPLKNRGAVVPGLQINSLVAIPIGSGTATAAAWILSGQRLVYVVSGEATWQRQELAVPTVSGAFPLEVWADGPRGRLGYTDGTVFSLPSRVQIGARLPTPQQRVVDYASACGQAFALAPEGLYRLVAVAGRAIGQWQLVPTGLISTNGFEGGRLHAVGGQLHLFTQFGESARLPLGDCP